MIDKKKLTANNRNQKKQRDNRNKKGTYKETDKQRKIDGRDR